jgi:hypothetical protein
VAQAPGNGHGQYWWPPAGTPSATSRARPRTYRSAGGTGAQAVAVVSNEMVVAVNVPQTGSGYSVLRPSDRLFKELQKFLFRASQLKEKDASFNLSTDI